MKVSIITLREMIRHEFSRLILVEDKGDDSAYPGDLGVGTPTGTPEDIGQYVTADEEETTTEMGTDDDPTDPAHAQKQKELRLQQTALAQKRQDLATG